ncbi:MAG: BtrH N-terminal domain-containing protein [Bacteroidales bacterium]|nr:BtrH N-terminal domain-containing protein [Bacteroidales bacterium]
MTRIPYQHKMAAHCETGTVSGLLNYNGLSITEPMVFGIASGIFFGYMKMSSFIFPVFFVRTRPGEIRKKISSRLGIDFFTKSYKKPEEAQRELDQLLEKNIPVAVKVDFFYMNYLAPWLRVHNNAHFITVVGKEDSTYYVSDCYHRDVAELDAETLLKARFAGGMESPRGFMFYPTRIPKEIEFERNIITGIRKAAFNMLKIPVPFLGVKGISRFADKVVGWPKLARDMEHLSHEVMRINVLLEDQGTGGGGFRFMYATFLRQASEMLRDDKLLEFSKRMMKIGDDWRGVSVYAIRMNKDKDFSEGRFKELSNRIRNCGFAEKEIFTDLYLYAKNYSK